MIQREVTVRNRLGLHARAAARFVHTQANVSRLRGLTAWHAIVMASTAPSRSPVSWRTWAMRA